MVAVDMAPLEKYLNVSPLKLQAKGVQSVRSRVANLRDFRPELTIQELEEALETAFSQVYGLPVQSLRYEDLDQQALAEGQARFSRPEWIYGDSRPMAVSREARFDWGLLRLDYDQQNGVITQAALWSDGLDADFLSQVPQLIQGCPLEAEALRARLSGQPDSVEEVTDGIVTLLTRNEETL